MLYGQKFTMNNKKKLVVVTFRLIVLTQSFRFLSIFHVFAKQHVYVDQRKGIVHNHLRQNIKNFTRYSTEVFRSNSTIHKLLR